MQYLPEPRIHWYRLRPVGARQEFPTLSAPRKAIVAMAIVAVVALLAFLAFYFPNLFVSPSNGDRAILASEFQNGTAFGLKLNLQVTPRGNGSIGLSVEENNTLSTDQPVQAADGWAYPSANLNPFDACGAIPAFPIGLAVFQGHYTPDNYSQARALALYNTTYAFTCTTNLYPIIEYDFIAHGYKASVIDSRSTVDSTENMTIDISPTGYWTGGAGTPQPATLHPFHGDFTVLAADEWGAIDLTYFTVK